MRHLSLFSGIGGIDLAAHWAGFTTVAFVEKDQFCQKVLAKNFPGVPIYDDVTTFDAKPFLGRLDLLSGGFPCQPFSSAGKRRGKSDDRFLWPAMLRIVRESRPAWILGENVAGFVSMALDDCLSDLGAEGYEAVPFVLPACGVGAVHKRDRCFIVAHSVSVGRGGRNYGDERRRSGEVQTARPRSAEELKVLADSAIMLRDGGEHNSERGGQCPRQVSKPRDRDCDERRIAGWWSSEPNVGRVANGVPRRVDRLKSLGNAVVPQQVYPILKAIADQIRGAA